MVSLPSSKPLNVPQTIQRALDLQRQGKLPQAETLYADVLSARPDYFEALNMLGLIKMQRGDLAGALQLMSGALKARPNSPDVMINYGIVLNALRRYDEALVAFDQVLTVKRRSVEALNNRGAVLDALGRSDEALASFDAALAVKSNHVDTLYNKASVLRKLERYDDALKWFDRAIAAKPDYMKAHNNRGTVLEAQERYDEALASYERALALDPNFVEALNNRGNALLKLGRRDEAVACYERGLALNPDHAEILYNRGNALAAMGRYQEALASNGRAIAVNPNYINAQWNEALLKLRFGDFAGGLPKYEWRWQRGEGLKHRRDFPQPVWRGDEPVAGKTMLIHAEQGLGDTIQFARYVPLLTQQGARVVLEVQPLLKPLLSQLGGGVQVIGQGEPLPAFDMHCPLLSLPLSFHTELASIPTNVPYLTARADRVALWRERFAALEGLRVGLVWSGNPTHKDDHNRSVALSRLAPLLSAPNVSFISLQKDVREADAAVLAQNPRVMTIGGDLADFDDTAAAIAAADLVISVDTSVAHLAGALGKPVWVLLPFCPDWRWLLDRDDNPWYPTARLFRQPAIGDWESVLEGLRRALSQFAS